MRAQRVCLRAENSATWKWSIIIMIIIVVVLTVGNLQLSLLFWSDAADLRWQMVEVCALHLLLYRKGLLTCFAVKQWLGHVKNGVTCCSIFFPRNALLRIRNWKIEHWYCVSHEIQTHKGFNRTLIYYDIDNTVHIFREIPFFRPQNDTERTVKRLKTMKNDMRDKVTSLFVVVFSTCWQNNSVNNILPASTEHNNKKEKLLHLSYHFSLFLTVSLFFQCRFVA